MPTAAIREAQLGKDAKRGRHLFQLPFPGSFFGFGNRDLV